MDWFSPIAVGVIAVIAAIVAGVINTQRVPRAIRQIDMLAAAAHAVRFGERTTADLNMAIRAQMLPLLRPSNQRVAVFLSVRLTLIAIGGTAATALGILEGIRAEQRARQEGLDMIPAFIVLAALYPGGLLIGLLNWQPRRGR